MNQPAATTQHVLVVTRGNAVGERFLVDGELLLGRAAQGGARLGDDPKLSRQHAKLICATDGSLVIEDLSSANGTWVNGQRIDHPIRLAAGDTVRVGDTHIEVQGVAFAQGEAPVLVPNPPVEQVGSPSSIGPVRGLLAGPGAAVLHAGRRIGIGSEGMTIGRLEDNDIVIASDRASRHHARIVPLEGRHYLADLDSMNGTYLNGERLVGESRWLNPGDAISIGGELFRYLTGHERRVSDRELGLGSVRAVSFTGGRLTIGRDPANDLHLDAPNISRFHAEIVSADATVELRDLGSRNGTRVNGERVGRASLVAGSEVGIGPFRLVFDGASFVQRDDRGALRLDAHGISVVVRQKTILNNVSLSIQPGEFVAVIGESGAGKTTLIRALAGVSRPTSGVVSVNGEPVGWRLTDIGYLPQDEIVHPRLTVIESLRYAARLRLPSDSSAQDVEAAVGEVMNEVALTEHAQTRIDSLSGGQRKRVGLATELLNHPGLIFLDEPTTGLDPGLERRMMQLFRRLAAVGRHAVCVTTHATRNLDDVDKLCVMGRGGELCFVGPPARATDFFGVSSYDEIYAALEDRPAVEWRHAFERENPGASRAEPLPTVPSPTRRVPPSLGVARLQARVLIERYLRVFLRDRRNVLILLLQVPLLALAMGLLFKPRVFAPPGLGTPSGASQLLFVLVLATIWFGTLDSAREIIKERAVLGREHAIGVDVRAYLASKVAVLFSVVSLQALVLFAVVLTVRHLHASSGAHLGLLVLLALTGCTAVAMGLLISSIANTDEQATALIPIAMIVQLLLGGAIVTVKNMGAVMGGLAALVFSRWSFAGAGSLIGMNERIAGDPHFRETNPYAHSFFSLPPVGVYAILLVFLVVFLALTVLALRRRVA